MPIDNILEDIKSAFEMALEEMKCRRDRSILKEFYQRVINDVQIVVKENENEKDKN